MPRWFDMVMSENRLFCQDEGGLFIEGSQRRHFSIMMIAFFLLQSLVRRVILPRCTWKGRRLLLSAWRRKIGWEYWPLWAFYPPVILHIVFLTVFKYKGKLTFTACNPAMPASGFIGEDKKDILDGLNSPWVARYSLLQPKYGIKPALHFMKEENLEYPIVLKPNTGQRGEGVEVIRNLNQLENSLARRRKPTIIQEYVPGHEVSVFYLRYPQDETSGRIFSITDKQFVSVVGNGTSTLETLILAHDRAVNTASFFLELHSERLQEIPPKGQKVTLNEIGAHCLGTVCKDGAHLITPELTARIDEISKGYKGFYFGRYDIRSPDLKDFIRGENFSILELNGVTSESTNIFDPDKIGLVAAWRVLCKQWTHACAIGAENHKRGAPLTSLRQLMQDVESYDFENEITPTVPPTKSDVPFVAQDGSK